MEPVVGIATCELMGDGPASERIALPAGGKTLAVCTSCARHLQHRAVDVIIHKAKAFEATPGNAGKEESYQPLDIDDPRVAELNLVRDDSEVRYAVMREVIAEQLGHIRLGEHTYVDIGCNTGYFCKKMSELGFLATGIDSNATLIYIASLAERFIHKRSTKFVREDAIGFIEHMSSYDVVSAFSVFQWLFITKPREAVYDALRACMGKARHLFFFDVGYQKSGFYKDSLKEPIDRDWCLAQLAEGQFDEVFLVEAGRHGLSRDFFFAVRWDGPGEG